MMTASSFAVGTVPDFQFAPSLQNPPGGESGAAFATQTTDGLTLMVRVCVTLAFCESVTVTAKLSVSEEPFGISAFTDSGSSPSDQSIVPLPVPVESFAIDVVSAFSSSASVADGSSDPSSTASVSLVEIVCGDVVKTGASLVPVIVIVIGTKADWLAT